MNKITIVNVDHCIDIYGPSNYYLGISLKNDEALSLRIYDIRRRDGVSYSLKTITYNNLFSIVEAFYSIIDKKVTPTSEELAYKVALLIEEKYNFLVKNKPLLQYQQKIAETFLNQELERPKGWK